LGDWQKVAIFAGEKKKKKKKLLALVQDM